MSERYQRTSSRRRAGVNEQGRVRVWPGEARIFSLGTRIEKDVEAGERLKDTSEQVLRADSNSIQKQHSMA